MSYGKPRALERFPKPVRDVSNFVFRWIPIAIIVGLWELASGWVVPETVLPPPSLVSGRTVELLTSSQFISEVLLSMGRIVVGLVLGISVGVLLGIGMARARPIQNIFDVFLALLYPVPKVALIPLAMLWLGRGTASVVFIIVLACLLPLVMNSYNAANAVDQNLIWSAKMMGTSDRKLLWKIVIPASIPEILTGVRQAVPIAFIALVSAEIVSGAGGLGYEILRTGQQGQYPSMFAVIVVVSAVGYFTVWGYERLEERVLVWT